VRIPPGAPTFLSRRRREAARCGISISFRGGLPSTIARPAFQKDRIAAVVRTRCAELVRAVIRGNEGAADACVGDQAGEPRRFGGIVAGDFLRKVICVAPSSCCSYALAPIRLRIFKRVVALIDRSRMQECQGFALINKCLWRTRITQWRKICLTPASARCCLRAKRLQR